MNAKKEMKKNSATQNIAVNLLFNYMPWNGKKTITGSVQIRKK